MKTVTFENVNSKQIFSILSKPQRSSKKIVIMSHGFRGTSIGPARTFVDFESVLLKAGYCVLRFDQPGSGNSEGDYLESSFNDWVATTTYFAKKFLDQDYQVALLGQSMGATTSVVASAQPELKDKIRCLLLWVPDPKSTFTKNPDQVFEEKGQKYQGKFWQEARDADFFKCLIDFEGSIHLVYGEHDQYISQNLRDKVISVVKEKGQPVMVLPGQDHSPWEFKVAQQVYQAELELLNKNLS